MPLIRALAKEDHHQLAAIYEAAVLSCDPNLYTPAQKQAWAAQASQLHEPLNRGQGLVSCSEDGSVLAFALREPQDRLALLYCHPQAQRQGHGQGLLRAIEVQAREDGCALLRTEASFLSKPLLLKQNWSVRWREELLINGVRFERFNLWKPILQPWPRLNSSNS
jgi:GNAT superfamily N-acetyltransferase